MPKKSIVLLPETREYLEQMGLQIKYARLRKETISGTGGRKSRNQQGHIMCD